MLLLVLSQIICSLLYADEVLLTNPPDDLRGNAKLGNQEINISKKYDEYKYLGVIIKSNGSFVQCSR